MSTAKAPVRPKHKTVKLMFNVEKPLVDTIAKLAEAEGLELYEYVRRVLRLTIRNNKAAAS
jgi:hypothetical protein